MRAFYRHSYFKSKLIENYQLIRLKDLKENNQYFESQDSDDQRDEDAGINSEDYKESNIEDQLKGDNRKHENL